METPRVPVQIVDRSERVQAALRFAAGPSVAGSLSSGLCYLCDQLSLMIDAPAVSVYVLEGADDLVLRGTHGYDRDAIGEVRLKVGQGITGTAVEAMRPVTVDDAGLSAQFAYFPQLAEERYPAYLAVPLVSGSRARGAVVLQRGKGPFTEDDFVLAMAATRALTALVESQHPADATLLLHGDGNRRGRVIGVATMLSRALPRRDPRRTDPGPMAVQLQQAFAAVREEVLQLADRARATLREPCKELEEIRSSLEDVRLQERALEHVAQGTSPSLALERIAAEVARALAQHTGSARRAVDVEAFLGEVAHRLAGLESHRVRRGELLVAVYLPGLQALRAWAHGAVGAVCAEAGGDSTGVPLLTALGLPVVSGVRAVFTATAQGARVAIDSDSGEVNVNPTAAQAAALRR